MAEPTNLESSSPTTSSHDETTVRNAGKSSALRGLWAWMRTKVGVLTTTVIVVVVVVILIPRLTESSRAQSVTYPSEITRVEIENNTLGAVRVTGAATNQIDLQTTVRKLLFSPRMSTTTEGNTVRVKASCHIMSIGRCDADVVVHAPQNATIVAVTKRAALSAEESTATVELRSRMGDITLQRTRGGVMAQSTTGKITGSQLGVAAITARSRSGDISLVYADAPQQVDAEGTSSSINIGVQRTPNPFRVDALTQSGKLYVDVVRDGGATRSIRAISQTGDVSVHFQ